MSRRDVWMVLVALVAGLVGGVTANKIFVDQAGDLQPQHRPQEVIRAARSELVDPNGKARIILGTERFWLEAGPIRGKGIFILADEANPIAVLGVDVYSTPVRELRGQKGTALATLATEYPAVTSHGPALRLTNTTKGAARLSVEGAQGGYPGARLHLTSGAPYAEKETGMELRTPQDFGATLSLTFTNPSSELDNTVSLDAYPGSPSLSLSSGKDIFPERRQGKELAKEELSRRGMARASRGLDGASSGPSLSINDPKGNLRTVLGTTSLKNSHTGSVETRPPSSLVLFGENGKVLWQAP